MSERSWRRVALTMVLVGLGLMRIAGRIPAAQRPRAAAAAVPGAQYIPNPASDPTGRRVFDLEEFAPNPLPGNDWSIALQNAVDFVRSQPNVYGQERWKLMLRRQYPMFRPVFFDTSNLDVEGVSSNVGWTWYHQSGYGFIGGLNRAPRGIPNSADIRPEAFGKLDATLAPRAGAARGLATKGQSADAKGNPATIRTHALLAGSAFAIGRGDGWESAKSITYQVAIEVRDWTDMNSDHHPLMGGSSEGKSGPFAFWYYHGPAGKAGKWWFSFTTEDGVQRNVFMNVSDDGSFPVGVQHLAYQVDSATGKASAYRNGVEVAADVSGIGANWKAGLALRPNENAPYGIGSASSYAFDPGADRGSSGDWVCYGHKISDAPVYTAAGAGNPQARADGKPLTDLNRYMGQDAADVAWFNPQHYATDPNLVSTGCRDKGGALGTYALYPIVQWSGWGTYTSGGNSFKNVKFWNSSDNGHGIAFVDGEIRGLAMDNCPVYGKSFGFMGQNSSFNSYPIIVNNGTFQGGFCAYYGFGQTTWMTNVAIDYCGRFGFMMAGSALYLDHGFCTPMSNDGTRAFVRLKGGTNANQLSIKNYVIDHEQPIRGMKAFVWVTAGQYQQDINLEKLDFWVTQAPNSSFVYVDGTTYAITLGVNRCYEFPMRALVTIANPAGGSPVKVRGSVTGVLDPTRFTNGVIEYLHGTETTSALAVNRYPGVEPNAAPNVRAQDPDRESPAQGPQPFPRSGVESMKHFEPGSVLDALKPSDN